MRLRALFVVACLLPAGCAYQTGPTNASMLIPPGALGTNQDPDLAAINVSSYTFAEISRMRGNPVGVARAVASVEYLASALPSSPRFQGVDPTIAQQMRMARSSLRRDLGIAPGTQPQLVVNGLLGAANAILARDAQGASLSLPDSVFTLGPQETLNRLANLPFDTAANVATLRLSHALDNGGGGRDCYPCG